MSQSENNVYGLIMQNVDTKPTGKIYGPYKNNHDAEVALRFVYSVVALTEKQKEFDEEKFIIFSVPKEAHDLIIHKGFDSPKEGLLKNVNAIILSFNERESTKKYLDAVGALFSKNVEGIPVKVYKTPKERLLLLDLKSEDFQPVVADVFDQDSKHMRNPSLLVERVRETASYKSMTKFQKMKLLKDFDERIANNKYTIFDFVALYSDNTIEKDINLEMIYDAVDWRSVIGDPSKYALWAIQSGLFKAEAVLDAIIYYATQEEMKIKHRSSTWKKEFQKMVNFIALIAPYIKHHDSTGRNFYNMGYLGQHPYLEAVGHVLGGIFNEQSEDFFNELLLESE